MFGMKTVTVEWEDDEIEVECEPSQQPSTGTGDWYPDIASILNSGYSRREADLIWSVAYDIANQREIDHV